MKKKSIQRKGIAFLSAIAIVAAMVSLAGCNTLQSIEISQRPTQTMIGQGQRLDTAGLAVTVIRSRDTEEVPGARVSVRYNSAIPGEQTVTVTFSERRRTQEATFTITVVPVVSLTITQAPTETLVFQGDDLETAGIVAWVEFENDAVPGVEIGPAQLSFSGFDGNTSGIQTITASRFGGTATFEVRVAAFVGINMVSPPTKTEYFVGEPLDLGGLAVMGIWEGYERPLAITLAHISNFDANRAGQQDVLITYRGATASFSITSVGFVAITIASPPSRLSYEQGEHLNLAGMQLQGTREGSTTIEMLDVSRAQISGHDRFRSGQQTITVSFGGRSGTFTITVGPNPFVVTTLRPWYGTVRIGGNDVPITLTMTENTWTVVWPEGRGVFGSVAGEYLSGTYTRDTETGRTAEFTRTAGINDINVRVSTGEILSPSELRLTGSGMFNNVTLTR